MTRLLVAVWALAVPAVCFASGGVFDECGDGDGDVDLLDLDTLGANWGAGPGAVGGCSIGDYNDDGFVNLLDLDILGRNFGVGTAMSTSRIPGDVDGDGDVDLLDLDLLGFLDPRADFDGNGDVDLLDLDTLGANWGVGTAAAVPEPGTAALFLTIAAVVGIGPRRCRSNELGETR